jgi:hypothetical protein
MNIVLKPHQRAHVKSIIEDILPKHVFAVDTSTMGAGKTVTTSAIVQMLGVKHLLVVCPASVKDTWVHHASKYNLPLILVSSYEALRSTTHKQPKHGLLTRTDVLVNGTQKVAFFDATPAFEDLVTEGVLMVVDEFHRVKNDSVQRQAVAALVKSVVAAGVDGPSRLLFLSGTPFDKREQTTRLLHMLCSVQDKLFTYTLSDQAFVLNAAEDIAAYAGKVDAAATAAILAANPMVSAASVVDATYKLYVDVLQPVLVRCMPPAALAATMAVRNLYMTMGAPAKKALIKGVEALGAALRFDKRTEKVGKGERNFGAMTAALMSIEAAKLVDVKRLAQEVLLTKDVSAACSKVVIAMNYTASVEWLAEQLAEYAPLILTGTDTRKQRTATIALFQQASAEHRLLIGNLAVMDVGIDLDDVDGKYPRVVFASPTYMIMRAHQFTGRFLRVNTRSAATVSFVYGKGAEELPVLNALASKSVVMAATLSTQVSAGALFPGAYTVYMEPEDEEAVDAEPCDIDFARPLKRVRV